MSLPALIVVLAVAGCGGSSKTTSTSDAQSAATGDIPDNQVFLTFNDTTAGFSIPYPEGWSQHGSGLKVGFENKSNTINVTVSNGPAPTVASAKAALARLQAADASVKPGAPAAVTIKGAPAIKGTYTSLSSPDPVTGKRLTIITDRYEYARAGKVAILDLGTPKGVDNVDAFRMISQSFKWL